MYTIYGTKTCPFCIKAVELCESRAFDYKLVIGSAELTDLAANYNHSSIPLIMKDDEFVGGYNDLHKSTGHHSALESTVWWIETATFFFVKRDEFKTRMGARSACYANTAARKEAK